jgi:hypothetical protein
MGRGTKLGKIEKLLLKEYKWECQGPKPGKKKGRSGILEIFGKYLSISLVLVCWFGVASTLQRQA